MALIFWGVVIGFLIGWLGAICVKALWRSLKDDRERRDPERDLLSRKPVLCPYCRKPATARVGASGPEIECRACGTSSAEAPEPPAEYL